MPVNLTAPGVYIEELPSAVRTITGVATSITAFVGRTRWGPVDEPVLVSSFGEFERRFGGLWLESPMTYSVRDFFLNGGAQALIVRAYNGPIVDSPAPNADGRARLTLVGSPPDDQLRLRAASPGAWGNELRAELDVVTDGEALARYGVVAGELFNLTLRLGDPATVIEQIRNVTVVESARRVDRVLEVESGLVRVDLDGDGDPILPNSAPGASDAQATGGADSTPLDAAAFGVGGENDRRGFYALENADIFNLLCLPADARGGNTPDTVYQEAMRYCVRRRAMLVVDPKAEWRSPQEVLEGVAAMGLSGTDARNAAIYFPRVVQADPLREGQLDTFVPCGIVSGVMAATDANRGVWKAPAGIDAALAGIRRLEVRLNDSQNGQLNDRGINCFRTFPVVNSVVWGARTMRGANQLADQYKYVPVRRLALYIEESLYRGTQWVVFEPNDESLWAQIRLNVGSFMQGLFRQGAFQGSSPRDAYLVKCDSETTTQDDINRGVVNVLVGFAPLKPAEFVIIQIQQLAGQLAA